MKRGFFDLPQEIWGKILSRIDEQDLAQVSLVSKQFLSITNQVKTTLKISDETLPLITALLRRFQNLETVIISTDPPINHVDLLRQIALSRLDHEPRKSLKRFVFRAPAHFSYKNLIALVDLFPWLEEISLPSLIYSPKKFVVQDLLPRLQDLKKLHFKKYCDFFSDELLVSLSSNCKKLESIDIGCSENIGEETIGFVMKNCTNLNTLILPKLRKPCDVNDPLCMKNAIIHAKNLQTIRLHNENVSEELVSNLGKAKPPLENLYIDFTNPYTTKMEKLVKPEYFTMLFQECPLIEHLWLNQYKHLSDSFVATISLSLSKLISIKLRFGKLTNASFFELMNNCPLLEEIEMDYNNLGVGNFSQMSWQKHEKVRHLSLSGNQKLGNRTLGYILYVCPNLQFLDVNYCLRITSRGVREIFKSCGSLTELNIGRLINVSDIFGDNFEGRTIGLKTLKAEETRLKDETLCKIGKICSELEYLDVSKCRRVTDIGVKEVKKNCKKLKTIYG